MVFLAVDLSWVIILVSFLTMVGVWLGPLLAAHWRKRLEIKEKVRRQIHRLLSDPSVGSEVINELLIIGKAAIKPLKKYEAIESDWVRMEIKKMLFQLGDKQTRNTFPPELERLLEKNHYPPELFRTIQELKITELAPYLFKRLKQEKDYGISYEIIRTLGALEYEPALPYLLELAENVKYEQKATISKKERSLIHAYFIALSQIAGAKLDILDIEKYTRIVKLFAGWLLSADDWLIDGIVKSLRPLVRRKNNLSEPVKDKLIKGLCRVAEAKIDLHNESIDVLVDIGDRNVAPFIKELLEKERDSSRKTRLRRALDVLSS